MLLIAVLIVAAVVAGYLIYKKPGVTKLDPANTVSSSVGSFSPVTREVVKAESEVKKVEEVAKEVEKKL